MTLIRCTLAPGIPAIVTFSSFGGPGKCHYVTDGVDFDTVYSGWTEVLFNDTAWPAPEPVSVPAEFGGGFVAPIPGTSWITSLDAELHEFGGGRDWLGREVFNLPPGDIISASIGAETPPGGAVLDVLKVNGSSIVSADITALVAAGVPNILAFHVDQIYFLGVTAMCYKITVAYRTAPPPIRLSVQDGSSVRLLHNPH